MPDAKDLPQKLSQAFYARADTEQIAKDLLGKFLMTKLEGQTCGGKIVETEAYLGREDLACHAAGGRRTARTEVMFGPPGISYVYLIYGIHHLFNVVTHGLDQPHAVLIRALEPSDGLETMLKRREMDKIAPRLTAGPGILTKALGIYRGLTGTPVNGEQVWIEDRGETIMDENIIASPRVGVEYAGEDALLPYRFRVRDSRWTSPAK